MKKPAFVLWFREIDSEDIEVIGQKGVGLAEMMEAGISIPNGFCVTPFAYSQFLKNTGLVPRVKVLLQGIDPRDPRSLGACSQRIEKLIFSSKIPEEITQAIMKNYLRLGGFLREALVAVRSSPVDERLNVASFLNIKGEANVVESVKKCWASLFEPENLLKKKGLLKERTAILVQRMIQSRVSGVALSTNPENKKEIIIRAIYGLGELAAEGKVVPDEYRVSKDRFRILKKEINFQPVRLIKSNKKTRVPKGKQNLQKLTDQEIINLAKLAKKIQHHYFFPQEIEFAIEKRKIYILQTQLMVTTRQRYKNPSTISHKLLAKQLLLKGTPANPGIVSGFTRVIKSSKEISKVKKDEILVSTAFDSKLLLVIRKTAGLVIEDKNNLSYGAMISRELGIPCVLGAEGATKVIKTGTVITVNGKTGEIFKGGWQAKGGKKSVAYKTALLKPRKQAISQRSPQTVTKIYVDLNNPQMVEGIAGENVDGALFKSEFLVSQIGVHPKKLIHDKKEKVFVEKLFEGLEKTCQTLNPKPVIYKALDFTTDEYRGLVGGKAYEPKEANPLLGFRGCTRYIADSRIFELQLEVIEAIRKRKKLRNLSLMIPFVRTVRELREIKKVVASHGLIRSPSFNLWVMLEVPSNVFLLEDFIKTGIDGVCLRLPKLLALTLAIDEENREAFSKVVEADFLIEEIFEKILKISKKRKLLSLICTQEKFLYPDLLERLVKSGINGICISPDAIRRTRELVYEEERRFVRSG